MIDLLCFIDKYLRLIEMQSPGSIHYSNQVSRSLSHFGTMFFRSVYQESRCTPFRRCVLSFLLARWQESNGWMRLRGWWIGAQFARYEARWVIQRALPADSNQMGKEGASEGGWYAATLMTYGKDFTERRGFWTLSCGTFETESFDCSGSEFSFTVTETQISLSSSSSSLDPLV